MTRVGLCSLWWEKPNEDTQRIWAVCHDDLLRLKPVPLAYLISKLTHVLDDCGLSKVLKIRTSYTWRLDRPAILETGKRIWKNVRVGTEDPGIWTWIPGVEWLSLLPLPQVIYQNSLEIHLLKCPIPKQKGHPHSILHSGMMCLPLGADVQSQRQVLPKHLRTCPQPTVSSGQVRWGAVLPPKV